MSMYQIEDLVECSIRQLCATATDLHQLRSDIHYLYEFQNLFDCSFTHFRVLKELLDCGYILLLEPQQHPLYAAEREKFEKILQSDFDYTPGVSGGYWCGTIEDADSHQTVLNKLCCDYGSPLWEMLVSKGILPEEAARPLRPLNPYELVLRIIGSISPEEDPYLHTHWYSFLPFMIQMMENQTEATEEVKEEARQALCCTPVFMALEKEEWLTPEEEILEEEEETKAWFGPYFEWSKNKDKDPEYFFYTTFNAFTKGDYQTSLDWASKGVKIVPENGFFYLYWAFSMILLQANETTPFDAAELQKALYILEQMEEDVKEFIAPPNLNYYKAIGYVVAGKNEQASASIHKAAPLLEENLLLQTYYQGIEERWLGKA